MVSGGAVRVHVCDVQHGFALLAHNIYMQLHACILSLSSPVYQVEICVVIVYRI